MAVFSGLTIELNDLEFRWPGQNVHCIHISRFTISTGERIFLYGPSGGGKSTLLSLLGGVALPQQGTIRLLGTELTQLSNPQRNRFRADHIGFIFQQFNLIPWLSAVDNALLSGTFSTLRRQRAGDMKKQAMHLFERLDLSPDLWDKPVFTLSVGQQQRVAAARALLGRPEIIIADEPTSSLDSPRQEAFIELLLSEASAVNATLIFVSHDERLAKHFDRKVALTDINRPLIDQKK
jgi:putative ABC transport system ATP-binding protein